MNVPLQSLQGFPTSRSAETQPRKSERAPAETAPVRKNNARLERKESFSDRLREASQTKNQGREQVSVAGDESRGDQSGGENGHTAVNDAQTQNSAQGETHGRSDRATDAGANDTRAANNTTGSAGETRPARVVPLQNNQSAANPVPAQQAGAPAPLLAGPLAENAEGTPQSPTTAINNNQAHNPAAAAPLTESIDERDIPPRLKEATAVELKPVAPQQIAQPPAGETPESNASAPANNTKSSAPSASPQPAQAAVQSSTPQTAENQRTTSSESTTPNKPVLAVEQPAVNQASAESARAQRASDQLRQRILRHVETADVEESSSAPADRRAGFVNGRIALENAAGRSGAPVDPFGAAANAATGGPGPQSATQIDTFSAPRLAPQSLAPQATLEPPVDDARFTNGVARGLSALVNQRGGVMHMRLDPPDLGQLRIQMTIARGAVTAQFQAADAQAGALLERNMGTLRAALERHGLSVERLAVQVHQSGPSHQSGGSNLNDPSQQGERNNNQHDAAGGQSRGRDDQSGEQRNERRRFTPHIETKPITFAQSLKSTPAQE